MGRKACQAMRTEQNRWTRTAGWSVQRSADPSGKPSVVLVFGSRGALTSREPLEELRRSYSGATLFGCSTAGEILGSEVTDESIVATAVFFERTPVRFAHVRIPSAVESMQAGRKLAEALPAEGLAHVVALSSGTNVNGSDLVCGLVAGLPAGVAVTGGLAGDGTQFARTLVLCDGEICDGSVAAMGLYGDRIRVGYGSMGGWDPFGPERLVTRAKGNVLYELDGRSALALYKAYLGEHARDLPASGLLFPLSLSGPDAEPGLVRTILAVDESTQSLTFAGDIPEGSRARLMKANFDRLIDGSMGAAKISSRALRGSRPDLGLLISCVGRKLILKQRVEEEVEGAREVLGPEACVTGFYSYGEISPFTPGAKCELHNQTMTITTLLEV